MGCGVVAFERIQEGAKAAEHGRRSRTWRRLARFTPVLLCALLLGLPGASLAGAQAHHTSAAQRAPAKPLTREGLEKSLRTGGMSSPAFVTIIKKRGVDFQLDHDTELELRGAGADANIIEAVSESYRGPSGGTSVAGTGPGSTMPLPAVNGRTKATPFSPVPTFREVTIPEGTVLAVQMTQTLNSGTTPVGQQFNGVLSQDLIVGNTVAVAHGTAVTGHVTEVKDAAHFAGSSKLAIELSSLTANGPSGSPVPVVTAPVSKEGAGRGKSTAVKTGGGAAAGAILGGILGGGKGAAVGATVGGGAGAGSSAITKGQQVEFASESVVQFTLSAPLLVRVSLTPAVPASESPRQPLRN